MLKDRRLPPAGNVEGEAVRHQHQCVTEFEIDLRDRNNWDRMTDWLDDRSIIPSYSPIK